MWLWLLALEIHEYIQNSKITFKSYARFKSNGDVNLKVGKRVYFHWNVVSMGRALPMGLTKLQKVIFVCPNILWIKTLQKKNT